MAPNFERARRLPERAGAASARVQQQRKNRRAKSKQINKAFREKGRGACVSAACRHYFCVINRATLQWVRSLAVEKFTGRLCKRIRTTSAWLLDASKIFALLSRFTCAHRTGSAHITWVPALSHLKTPISWETFPFVLFLFFFFNLLLNHFCQFIAHVLCLNLILSPFFFFRLVNVARYTCDTECRNETNTQKRCHADDQGTGIRSWWGLVENRATKLARA